MQRALSAVKLLTIWGRFHDPKLKPGEIARTAVYFPLVGAVLGLVLLILNHFLEAYLPSEILGVSLVAAWAITTGAISLEGLQRTFDGVGATIRLGHAKHGSRIFGLIAVILIVHLKINSLEAIGDTRNVSLLLAPILARWGVVILLYGLSSAVESAHRARPAHLVLSTAFILTLTVLIAAEIGLWIVLCVSLVALLARTVILWRQAQVSHDHLGALVETSEALSLVAFATL